MLLHPGGTSWIYGHDSVMDSDDHNYMFDERWFHVTYSSDLSHIQCHTRAYFHFRWDLRIFTKVTCSTIDDFMSLVLLTCRAPDAILGHIFHFIWDLWIFMDVACSMINDFMLPTLRPIIRSMSTRAYYHSGWNLYILVELRAYPHLRDVPRDDDLFTIFTMIPQ